jgi:hypothetical protein
MIYRKTPPQPPRLLLRVVAGVGAFAAAAGIAACSSSTSGGGEVHGSVVNPEAGGGDSSLPCGDGVCGSVAEPDGGNPCNLGFCDGGGADTGIIESVDSGDAGPVGLFGNDSGSDQ